MIWSDASCIRDGYGVMPHGFSSSILSIPSCLSGSAWKGRTDNGGLALSEEEFHHGFMLDSDPNNVLEM